MLTRFIYLGLTWAIGVAACSSTHAVDSQAPPAPPFPFAKDAAERYRREYATWAKLPLELTNAIGMRFVLVPPGTFTMGSPDDEAGRNPGDYDEGPRHTVTLSRPIYLGKHEVTQEQFSRFIAATGRVTDGERTGGGNAHDARGEWKHRPGTNWRRPGFADPYDARGDHPVVHVSQADAVAFCRWLSEQPQEFASPLSALAQRIGSPRAGVVHRLPTEAEWEWACRAGTNTRYTWGNEEDRTGRRANVGDRSLQRTLPDWPRVVMPMDDGHPFLAPVGSFEPNAFGLHDMIGNVWEFCSTRYGAFPREATIDPTGGSTTRGFAVRGGGWSNAPRDVRSAVRNADPPHFCHNNLGFRVALCIAEPQRPSVDEVLAGLQDFFRVTARPDGSFQPGIAPKYRGISDASYSDLAAVTYAVTLSKTFGWKLPYEERTIKFLLSRQKPNGDFFNVAGTVSPESPEGRTYNTTQGVVALHALGRKPKFDPLPVFEEILKADYRQLPAYSTSFFPLAYLCSGRPIPEQADRGIRALMVQDETGYTNDHVAATFHASHYYRLIGEETPRSREMTARVLRDQQPDGSWLMNMPARDRHATFDAVFTLVHNGDDGPECRAAIRRAAEWALSCRNDDGGFGHYPGSTSDADANYFQIGVLVMAGVLPPVDPPPADPELLSWGHLMPIARTRTNGADKMWQLPGWAAAVAYHPDGDRLATASADGTVRVFDVVGERAAVECRGHAAAVSSVQFHPDGNRLATGSFDHTAAIWDAESGQLRHRLQGHRGAVMSVAFSPDRTVLATGGIDRTIRLWDIATGRHLATLTGHRSWVNSLAFHPRNEWLASGGSDGAILLWSTKTNELLHTIEASNAEVRSIAVSPTGEHLLAGIRYGIAKLWTTADRREQLSLVGQGDHCAVAFSPDGKQFAVSEGDWNRGGLVRIHDTATGDIVARKQHTGEVLSIAFSPQQAGRPSLAAAAADKTVRLWRITEAQSASTRRPARTEISGQ